jgi:hypothetical protein
VDTSVAKELTKVKRLTQGIQEEPTEDSEFDIEQMLGGMMDTNIGKIAQEVAGSMDIESMFGDMGASSNPMEIMSQMMNPDKMGSIFKNINSVVEKKMEEGSLNKDDLQKEAEGMYGNMAQNPLFANMMGQVPKGEKSSDELSHKDKQDRLKQIIRNKGMDRSGK